MLCCAWAEEFMVQASRGPYVGCRIENGLHQSFRPQEFECLAGPGAPPVDVLDVDSGGLALRARLPHSSATRSAEAGSFLTTEPSHLVAETQESNPQKNKTQMRFSLMAGFGIRVSGLRV